jgi:hypothetical protein
MWAHQIAKDGQFGILPLQTSHQALALHPALLD